MKQNDILRRFDVLVRCFTFNQTNYIIDALNGFSSQRTNFEYLCLIVDDASTDSTDIAINKFINDKCKKQQSIFIEDNTAQIVFTQHSVNNNCYFVFYFLKQNLYKNKKEKMAIIQPWRDRCKYEAICEGDDYWVDNHKLQKQYDALESNKNATLCYTGFYSVNEDRSPLERFFLDDYLSHSHSGCLFYDLLVNLNYIMTVTTMFRYEALKDVPFYYYDYGMFLYCARQGDAIFIEDKTACYRYNKNSITNTIKDSLLPLFYSIVYNEICTVLEGTGKVSSAVKSCNKKKTILGYIIVRNIRKSTLKKKFLKLLLTHPSLYFYAIKGVLIKCFAERNIREYVTTI